MERRVEGVLERGHGELNDAGVDLADEGADAHRADHEPGIKRPPLKKRQRRGLGEREGPAEFEVPGKEERERAKPIGAAAVAQREFPPERLAA